MPGILFRYLFLIVLRRSFLSLALLLLLYSTLDLAEGSARYAVSGTSLLLAYPWRIPLAIVHLLPAACALGTALAISTLKTRGEWDAICATGLRPRSVSISLLLLAAIGSFASTDLAHHAAPIAMNRYESALGIPPASTSLVLPGDPLELRYTPSEAPRWSQRIHRDDTGRLVAIETRSANDPHWKEIWRAAGSQPFAETTRQREEAPSVPAPTRGADGLLGAGWTSGALLRHIKLQEEHRINAAPLKAEIALRTVLAVSPLILSFAAFQILSRRRRLSATFAVSTVLILCGVFWAILVTSWQGAALGMWPSEVIIACAIIFGATAAMPGRKLTRSILR